MSSEAGGLDEGSVASDEQHPQARFREGGADFLHGEDDVVPAKIAGGNEACGGAMRGFLGEHEGDEDAGVHDDFYRRLSCKARTAGLP